MAAVVVLWPACLTYHRNDASSNPAEVHLQFLFYA